MQVAARTVKLLPEDTRMGTPADIVPAAADDTDPALVIASAWNDQTLWSAVATKLGNSIKLWRFVAAVAGLAGLFLTVLAGTLGSAPATGPLGNARAVIATVGVLLLAVVPYLRQRLLSPERVLAWTRARNVSEQLKEAIYRHLMGVLPPEPLSDGTPAPEGDSAGHLVRRCRAIKQAAADLAGLAAAARPEARTRKTRLTLDDYLAERVEGQIRYYLRSGEVAGTQARRLQMAEFGLGILTVLLGTLSGTTVPADVAAAAGEVASRGIGDAASQVIGAAASQVIGAAGGQALSVSALVPWLALVAAATSAVTTHIAGARHAELAARYFATYDLLKTLRDEWRVSPDPHEPARVRRFVDDVERAIASEYGGWVADWSKAQQKAPQA